MIIYRCGLRIQATYSNTVHGTPYRYVGDPIPAPAPPAQQSAQVMWGDGSITPWEIITSTKYFSASFLSSITVNRSPIPHPTPPCPTQGPINPAPTIRHHHHRPSVIVNFMLYKVSIGPTIIVLLISVVVEFLLYQVPLMLSLVTCESAL